MSSTNLLLTSYIATTAENPLHLLQATSAPCFRNAKSFRTLLERNQKGVQRSAFSSRKADSLSACSSSLARQRLVTSTLPNQKIPGLSCSLPPSHRLSFNLERQYGSNHYARQPPRNPNNMHYQETYLHNKSYLHNIQNH